MKNILNRPLRNVKVEAPKPALAAAGTRCCKVSCCKVTCCK